MNFIFFREANTLLTHRDWLHQKNTTFSPFLSFFPHISRSSTTLHMVAWKMLHGPVTRREKSYINFPLKYTMQRCKLLAVKIRFLTAISSSSFCCRCRVDAFKYVLCFSALERTLGDARDFTDWKSRYQMETDNCIKSGRERRRCVCCFIPDVVRRWTRIPDAVTLNSTVRVRQERGFSEANKEASKKNKRFSHTFRRRDDGKSGLF